MDQEQPQHEKIRFRRDEIADLGALPSACLVPPLGRARDWAWRARCWPAACSAVAVLALVLVAAVIGGQLAAASAAERLRIEAETRDRNPGRRRCSMSPSARPG